MFMMREKANRALVRRVYGEILNEGNLEVADEVIAVDAIDHAPDHLSSLPTAGPDDLKKFVRAFCCAFPDAQWEIEEMTTVDDTVVVHTMVTGTNLGAFLGVPPTGDEMTIVGTDILRIIQGKIVEHWGTLPPLELATVLSSPFRAL
jgi:predicted SnoaL-like aldol condensation-catalyzing enzyme